MFKIIRNKYKSIDKYFNNKDWNAIIQNLIEQDIANLKKNLNEEEIISTVRENYKDNSSYTDMKLILIELDNLKLYRSKFRYSNLQSLLIALILGVISWVVSLSGNKLDGSYILYLSYILLGMIAVGAYHDLFKDTKDTRLDISINIHKSVIEERLKIIEEKKQQQNEQLIQELLKCNNEDKDILKKACNKIINDIF